MSDMISMLSEKMNILLVGSGGREHALARSISASPLVDRLFCAPGNAGIAGCAEIVELDTDRHTEVVRFCRQEKIGLVVVGPEAPLVAGIADALERAGIPVFGPSAAAAEIEGSKSFMKQICREARIATADYVTFTSFQPAMTCVEERGTPIVIKEDGLAAGKGVTVAQSLEEARDALKSIFKVPGSTVVVEECLEGDEVSVFAVCDGTRALAFGSAQDYKRIFEDDRGPNTGGMGAYSPVTKFGDDLEDRIIRDFVNPTLQTMSKRGTPFKGVLFAGLMMTKSGPKLLEYNARFGDPETQVILRRLKSDIVPVLHAAARGKLGGVDVEWSDDSAVTVVMASGGYPGAYEKGHEISGLEEAASVENAVVFHAGTRTQDGATVTNGGRVLNVTATGDRLFSARHSAYEAVRKISWPGAQYRKDIARQGNSSVSSE